MKVFAKDIIANSEVEVTIINPNYNNEANLIEVSYMNKSFIISNDKIRKVFDSSYDLYNHQIEKFLNDSNCEYSICGDEDETVYTITGQHYIITVSYETKGFYFDAVHEDNFERGMMRANQKNYTKIGTLLNNLAKWIDR